MAQSVDEFALKVPKAAPVDVVVLQLTLLGPDPEAAYERCVEDSGAEVVVVTYHFASRGLLERLATLGARLLKAPVELAALKRILREQLRPWNGPESAEPSPPLYDVEQLIKFRSIPSAVECECPHHLAQLIEMLMGFERYSATCEQRSDDDEAIHRALRRGTGQVRMQMERLLQMVLEYEGIAP